MGKIKYFENKESIISSDNWKQYRILDSDLMPFYDNLNTAYNGYCYESDGKYEKEVKLFDEAYQLAYDDSSFSREFVIDFSIYLKSWEEYMNYLDYVKNFEKYNWKKLEVFLYNKKYNYTYNLWFFSYSKNNWLEKNIEFNVNDFILNFSKYVLWMDDWKWNFEDFVWE